MEKLKLFVTGGTFDKEYNELNGQLYFTETHIHDVLKEGRSMLDLNIEILMLIDSLDMQSEQREAIAKACLECPEKRIVLTHGTDTMAETAALLHGRIQGKTVILTGAMIPYTFGSSDGLFNLGSALAFAQSMPEGVYVAMNGKLFQGNNVRKNKASGCFEVIQ